MVTITQKNCPIRLDFALFHGQPIANRHTGSIITVGISRGSYSGPSQYN